MMRSYNKILIFFLITVLFFGVHALSLSAETNQGIQLTAPDFQNLTTSANSAPVNQWTPTPQANLPSVLGQSENSTINPNLGSSAVTSGNGVAGGITANADGSGQTVAPAVNGEIGPAGTQAAKESAGWMEKFLEKLGGAAMTGIANTISFINGIILQTIFIPLMAVLVRISGAILDTSVIFTLSSANLGGKGGEGIASAINTVWGIVRDIINITFIFVLLYASIRMILGTSGTDTKKTVANVVVAALLINFSLFITRIVIDAGNLLAVPLYEKIKLGRDVGLGTILFDSMGLTGFWNFEKATQAGWGVPLLVISYLQLGVLLIAFVTFLYVSLLMVARTVALIFLMAVSPIGFIGSILPKLAEYSKSWRENLYGQVSVAPLFLLFMYLIILVAGRINEAIIAANKTIKIDGEGSKDVIEYLSYFQYLFMIVLLIVAVKITKKASGAIGSAVEKVGVAAAGIALGAATGGVALLGRATLGRAAASIASNEGLATAASKGGVRGFGARMVMRGADSTSKRSFDARNTSSFKSVTGFIGDQTGLKVNYDQGMKIQKDGYQGMVERATKRSENTAKLINSADINVDKKGVDGKTDVERATEALQTDKANRLAAKKQEIDDHIRKNGGVADFNNDKKLMALAEERDKINAEAIEQDKIREELIKTKKQTRRDIYASTEENSIVRKAFNQRDRKKMAKKFRETGKEKTNKDLLEEALKKIAEDEAKKNGNSATAPAAPAASAPATSPTSTP